MIKHVLLTCISVLLAGASMAQDTTVAGKSFSVLPVPAFGKSIETGWYGGAVSLFKIKGYWNSQRYSTGKVEFNYTQYRQVIINTSWFVYTGGDRHILTGDNSYLYFPEYYYGIGNTTPKSNELFYTARRLELYNSFLWQLRPGMYAGASARVQRVFGLEPEDTKPVIRDEINANNAVWTTGIGPHLLIDNRDRILNPSAGSYYIQVEDLVYGKSRSTRGTSVYNALKTDVRVYRKLFARSVIAFQYYGLYNFGNAPFRLMGLLGSDSHMRGYYQGRYRDQHYAAVQSEARIRIVDWLGVTAFAGAGDVFATPGDLTIGRLKYSLGGGIRIRVDKTDHSNLRFDYAAGKGSSGFYVAFGEAF
jgi:hypothetical protein